MRAPFTRPAPTRRPLRTIAAAAAAASVALAPLAADAATLVRDAEIERTLHMMADPLFRAAGQDPDSFHIYIIQDDTMNAFAANGRDMAYFTGLLTALDKPEQLQAVMAHETGHIVAGHIARRSLIARRAAGPAAVALLLGVAAAIAGGGKAGVAAGLGAQSTVQRMMLAYSRGEESAADQLALKYLKAAHVDPEGMIETLEKFRKQEIFFSTHIDPYALSHPISSERMALVKRQVEESPYAGKGSPKELQYWFDRMRAKLEAFIDPPSRTLSRLDASDHSEIATLKRAIALHRAPQVDAAMEEVDRLIAMRPKDPFYRELKGQFLLENGRGAEAVAPYRKAAALAPDEPLITGGLGRALLSVDTPEANAEAIKALERGAATMGGEPSILRDLALAYARAGEDGMSSLATAERIALTGDIREAQIHARRAQAALPKGSPAWLRADDILAAKPPEQ